MKAVKDTRCYACNVPNSSSALRPYGPGGSWVCFPCAMTPERKKTTEAVYKQKLEAAGPIAVIGNENGPMPLTKYLNGKKR